MIKKKKIDLDFLSAQAGKNYLFITGNILILSLSLVAVVFAIGEKKSWGHQTNQGATITISGEGEAVAVPDISVLSFTIRMVGATVPEAQKKAEDVMKIVNDEIIKLGVSAKDIKTTSYTVNPKYSYETASHCARNCPPPKQKLDGYEVAETVQVKVRNIDNSGKVLALLGTNNVTEISGPDFTIDDMDKINMEAKAKAIEDAKSKAEATAKSLGVELDRIVGFSEGGNYSQPVYSMMSAKAESVRDVTIPAGENIIKKIVSITYEIE